jgi:hypothetical protein
MTTTGDATTSDLYTAMHDLVDFVEDHGGSLSGEQRAELEELCAALHIESLGAAVPREQYEDMLGQRDHLTEALDAALAREEALKTACEFKQAFLERREEHERRRTPWRMADSWDERRDGVERRKA